MDTSKSKPEIEFKKPILIGKIGKLPRMVDKMQQQTPKANEDLTETENEHTENIELVEKEEPPSQSLNNPIPYKEPNWSGIADNESNYTLEVLKSGKIIENIDLSNRPFWIFGRFGNCDMIMAHPTISRYCANLNKLYD